jgi:hypothetical protein
MVRRRPLFAHPGGSRDPSRVSFVRNEVVQLGIQVPLGRIEGFDQFDFPASTPLLDLALAPEGSLAAFESLEPDELSDIVFCGETAPDLFFVFEGPLRQVVGAAGIQRPVRAAGQDLGIETHPPLG